MQKAHLLDFKTRQPRRNLPGSVSRKRGESNFVTAFTEAYISAAQLRGGFGGKEFALAGYGIADFVWLTWQKSPESEDGTALSIEGLKAQISQKKLTAFEMKLTDWRKGLSQAYRYSYFADAAILVLPTETAGIATHSIELFRQLGVGLWSFDKVTGKIRKVFTPRGSTPRNATAREKALELFSRGLAPKLRKSRKQLKAI